MGKVKADGDQKKFSNEVIALNNRRRKKRRKELDLLRKNVLENKRKLDNKTQGFDNKGRKSGLKKICNRLLPSRKPQVGIFANGAKGAEIKRVNLSLNESDRARFEGDLQKVLDNGKRKCKESRSDVLFEEILHRPSVGRIDTTTEEFIKIPEKKLENQPVENFLAAERQSGKRKMQVSIESGGNSAKKAHSQMEDTKEMVQYNTKVKSERKNSTDKKCKRSLFQDGMEEFEPISELGVEQLRFSPVIGKTNFKVRPSQPELLLDIPNETPNSKKLNFNHGRLGRMAATKYKELCGIVCAENFDTCLREIPHIDPLTKVKQSLMNFYAANCKRKSLRKHIKPEVLFGEESSNSSSYNIPFNNDIKNEYSDEDVNLVRSESDGADVVPLGAVCLGNLKKFCQRKSTESSSTQCKTPITKPAYEVKRSKNISCVTRGPPSSETSITERNTSSLDVNYDSSIKSLNSDILEFFQNINEGADTTSVVDLERISNPRLAGIPSHRKKTMLRYLKEVNNSEPPEEDGSIRPVELSAVSAENNDVQKCYLGDPLRRQEIRMKQSRKPVEKKLDEIRPPSPFEGGKAEKPQNSLDVNCESVETRLGLDIREFLKTDERVKPKVINLGSASSSTLARIPSDRGGILLKFLQGVNEPEPTREDKEKFLPKVFSAGRENNKLEKHCVYDPSRNEETKRTSVQERRPMKNDRHVPAILRKSQAIEKNKKSNTAVNVFAKGVPEIGNVKWQTSNFNFQKLSSGSEAITVNSQFDKIQALKKPQSTANPFLNNSDNSTNREWLDFMKKITQTSQLKNRGSPVKTPTIVNAFYNPNNQGFKVKREFLGDKFCCESSAIGQKNIAVTSEKVNFSGEFNIQSPTMFRQKNSADNLPLPNSHTGYRQSLDLPIFLHQQQPNAKIQRVPCDEKIIPSRENQDSQRFPVFLNRKTASSTQKRMQNEAEHKHRRSPKKGKPKVIIIEKTNLRGYDNNFCRNGVNQPHSSTYKNESENPQQNGVRVGPVFSKFSSGMQMTSMNPVQLKNGRRKMQQLQVPADNSRQNVAQHVQQMQFPRLCVCETKDKQNSQHTQLPRIVHYENEMRKIANHKHIAEEVAGNNPMNFFAPSTFDIPASTSQRMFQPDSSSNIKIPETCVSSYCGNTNSGVRRDYNSSETVQFFDRRVGNFDPQKNQMDSLRQSTINLPIIIDQTAHTENYCSVLSQDKNRNYKYLIDPRCPQAGYKWNQTPFPAYNDSLCPIVSSATAYYRNYYYADIIDQNGAQVHQRVIQPAYNVTDAYRPQLPHIHFSQDP